MGFAMVGRRRFRRRDSGATSLELALYMPILFLVILVTVQVALLFLGNQAANAAAREAARVAREEGGGLAACEDGREKGRQYAVSVGHGLIDQVVITCGPAGDQEVRATVNARGVQVMPGFPGAAIQQVSQGPIEDFRPDPGI
jgi:Flp pilus assembly protein TadG